MEYVALRASLNGESQELWNRQDLPVPTWKGFTFEVPRTPTMGSTQIVVRKAAEQRSRP